MVVGNIFSSNSTNMSLSERFTILQSVRPVVLQPRQRPMSNMRSDQEWDVRNRRLIERLAIKPIVDAAVALQRRPLKQRIGYANRPNVQKRNIFNSNRLNLPTKKTSMIRRPNRFNNVKKTLPLRRQNVMKKSYSVADLSQSGNAGSPGNFRNANVKRGRGARGKNKNRFTDTQPTPRGNDQQSNYVRGRSTRRRGVLRGQGNPGTNETPTTAFTGGRGRGRNQKRGINRSWFAQKAPPTKEELDKQLDMYMAGTRSQLDKELDVYMSNAMDVE